MNQAIVSFSTPVTLELLLTAREQRQIQQIQLLQQYTAPLISLTINMPGKYKLTEDSHFLFEKAVGAIESLAKTSNWNILYQQQHILITGAEAFWVVAEKEAIEVKKILIELEQQHPLGRLWDIDVFDPQTSRALSRKMLSIEPRSCLICNNNAKACARSQKHTLQQLLFAIHEKIANYRNNYNIPKNK